MIHIRQGVFETNSSSTHSITMCMKSDYDAWVNGEVYFNSVWHDHTKPNNDKDFLTRDEAIELVKFSDYYDIKTLIDNVSDEELKNISDEELASEYAIYTFDKWYEYHCGYLDVYKETFTTPNGDEVVAFGDYGHD